MSQALRHSEILALARRDGMVTVEGLAAHFNVTVQTLRRDLGDLADAGQLMRVHGGAVLPSGTVNIAHEERRSLNSKSKGAIARACAAAIPDGASLFLNIGTSTEAVAQALAHHVGLFVVTNSLSAVPFLQANKNTHVTVTGGKFRRSDGGLVGPMAIETVHQFKLDFAIIGCSAMNTDGDLLDYDLDEVAVSRAILNAARSKFLVTDHTKFQRSAPARIAGVDLLDGIFTDAPLPAPVQSICAAAQTEVTLATS